MTSPTKFYHVTQILLQMHSCDQSFVTQLQFYKYLTRKKDLSEGCSWFKFSNLELVLVVAFKSYISVTKGLKLKLRKFLGEKQKVFRKLRRRNRYKTK